MAGPLYYDLVEETTSSSGTSDFTFAGATTGHRTWLATVANGNTGYYAARGYIASEWEVGLGTMAAGVLQRTTVLASSTGSKVNFTGTAITVRNVAPAAFFSAFSSFGLSLVDDINAAAGRATLSAVGQSGTFVNTAVLVADGVAGLAKTSSVTIDDTGSLFFPAGSGGNGGTIYAFGGTGTSANAGGISIQGGSAANASGGGVEANGGSASGCYAGSFIAYGGDTIGAHGGSLDMSGDTLPGGSITTSDGGGSIITTGTGSIGLGVSGTRTTLTGTATTNRAIALPDVSGTLAVPGSAILVSGNTWTTFPAAANTDTARGDALLAAITAAVTDDDTILLSPGTFNVQAVQVDLSRAGAGRINIRGSGVNATTISTTHASAASIRLGSACELSDLTVYQVNPADGTFGYTVGIRSSDSACANVTINGQSRCAYVHDIRIIGHTDGIYFANGTACVAVFERVEVITNYDGLAMVLTNVAHDITLRDCVLKVIGPNTAGTGGATTNLARAVRVQYGTLTAYNCFFSCVNGGTTQNSAVLVSNSGAAYLYGCRTYTSNGGNPQYDLERTSGTLSVDAATVYDATKTSGTITYANTTGSGNVVRATSPTLVTPTLGVATATSVNKVAITAPATSATLTIADTGSLITSGAYSITLTATAATNVTLPTTGTLATLAGSETFTNKTLTAPTLGGITTISSGSINFSGNSGNFAAGTLGFYGNQLLFIAGSAGFLINNSANSLNLWSMDGSGNSTFLAALKIGGGLTIPRLSAAPSSPATGYVVLYVLDATPTILRMKDSSGTVISSTFS